MAGIRLIQHAPVAPGLRWLGLGPGLKPTRGLLKLQNLLNKHAFWAQGRSTANLRKILSGAAGRVLRVQSRVEGSVPGGGERRFA